MNRLLALAVLLASSRVLALDIELVTADPGPDPIVVELQGSGVPQGCQFLTSSIDMTGPSSYRLSGRFGTTCSTMVQPLSGPATARVGVAFVVTWQARSPVTCTSGVGSGGSVFPAQVVNWPTSNIGTGTVLCTDTGCGNGAPVSRSVVATATGVHTFRLACYPLGSSGISYVSTLVVTVTP